MFNFRLTPYAAACAVALVMTLPRTAWSEESNDEHVKPTLFSETKTPDSDWEFGWNGYIRMPVRMHGTPTDARPPYLVDDNYYLSGFGYTRVNETEWAEIFFNAQKGNTRAVVGLFASQFSDWSETTLSGQSGIATAFVEHEWETASWLDLGVRAGMFWERFGFIEPYDTYLFGRTHAGGLALDVTLFDNVSLKFGYGAHADVISSNQGFTPVAWSRIGYQNRWLDGGLYALKTWTTDSEREFAIVEDGSLRVLGGDLKGFIPAFGSAYAGFALYKAENVLFLANSFELMHSTGGRGLTENFFGPDSENGTGEMVVSAFDVTWQPWRAVKALGSKDASRYVRGLDLRVFGMSAWVLSKQSSDDPAVNRNDRHYFKWGTELLYRPNFKHFQWLFAGCRYDRVILDLDHDSLSFRLITPRIGVTPKKGVDIFVSYSKYYYGDNVRLRPNQVPGDLTITTPDDSVFKIQAQASW